MPGKKLQICKGEVKIPEGMFLAVNHKGQLVQITEEDFETIKEYMLLGYGFYNIAKKMREEKDHPNITFGALRYFIDIVDRISAGAQVKFPVPDWMYHAAVSLLETREALRDIMYEKQTQFAMAGDRPAFSFLLRQGKELVGLPEDLPHPDKTGTRGKDRDSAKVVPIKPDLKPIESADLETAIKKQQEELDDRSRQNANA